jgi:hypothetical protein
MKRHVFTVIDGYQYEFINGRLQGQDSMPKERLKTIMASGACERIDLEHRRLVQMGYAHTVVKRS